MRKLLVSAILLFLPFAGQAGASTTSLFEEENYCHDPDAEAEWQEMVTKYPDDFKVQTLHALRIGLCAKVDAGHITLQQAIGVFEALRGVMVDKAFQEQVENIDRDTVL
jgi:hypothetical protein